jgi:hypothetical protein
MSLSNGERDRDVRLDMQQRLMDTGKFNEVTLKGMPEKYGAAAGSLAFASIQHESDNQVDVWDGGDETGGYVDSVATILLAVREQDPQLRDEKAELLKNVVRKTLNGKSLAGLTCPDWTRVGPTKNLPANSVERRVSVTFRYRYLFGEWDDFGDED